MKITDASARALTLPEGVKDRTFFDEDLPRFGIRIRAGGSSRYVVHYAIGRKERRVVLGAIGALSASKARATAKDILAKVRLGQDPLAEKHEAAARATETLGSLLPRYLAQKRIRPRSLIEINRHLQVHAKPLHSRPLTTFPNDRRLISRVLDDIAASSGATCARDVRSSLSAYCRWLMARGVLDVNPMLATNPILTAPSRDHLISDSELKLIWHAASGCGRYGAVVRLLMVLGLRREEVGGLLWEEINFDEGIIHLPAERCKNKRPHDIPLTDLAIDILAAQPHTDGTRHVFGGVGRGGFGGWSISKKELDANLGDAVRPWVLHDLRRVLSTAMHERLQVAPHVVEACLGHHAHRTGVAGTYNRSQYINEKHIALGKWAALLQQIVTGQAEPAKVFRLPTR